MISCIVGLHLLTYHLNRDAGFNETNPGVYTTCNGYTAGVYYNSERKVSEYVGYTVEYKDVAVTVGVVHGYAGGPAPMLIPSVKLGKGFRLAYIPQNPRSPINTQAIHLMKEF
ncbi:MAG TPA: hypothetical protein VFM18_23400 [Methanosarcina sp.]|nr:hypothetical protein [Methanosarcina sp.]